MSLNDLKNVYYNPTISDEELNTLNVFHNTQQVFQGSRINLQGKTLFVDPASTGFVLVETLDMSSGSVAWVNAGTLSTGESEFIHQGSNTYRITPSDTTTRYKFL